MSEAPIKIDINVLDRIITQTIHKAMSTAGKEWLTKKEAAQVACCSVYKLDLLIKAGEIEAAHSGIKGQTVTISRLSINKWHQRNSNRNATKKPSWQK